MSFKSIVPKAIDENVFKLIGTDWMLITAGTMDSFNTMTASWGGLGVLWHRDVAFCFIRPIRYTYEFMNKSDYYTLMFFEEKYRNILKICGTKSGRNIDKVEECNFTPIESINGAIYFKEARFIIECRKIYITDIDPEGFVDSSIENNYPQKDYHRMFVGEIVNVMLKNN
jgi:flavin reductase (DIM6/NTAB) family NADH-FMN oxidoreductase RutF